MDTVLLQRQQKSQAAKVFYRSFRDYPQMVCYFPDEQVRERYLEWYLSCVIEYALRYGEVFTNREITGFSCWLPPERTEPSYWGYILSGFLLAPLRFGLKKYMRVVECEDYTGKMHKKLMPRPHYYVWVIGVDPDQQSQGIGTQLLQAGVERASQKGLPVYLETHDPKNIQFYEKRDFKLICEDRVPGHNLPFWCFARDP